MDVKTFIKLIMPPVVPILYRKIRYSGKKVMALQESPLPQFEHHSNKMIIIGNGPSLKQSIDKYKDEILSYDRIAVNFFASSDLFEILKPNIYLFADPAFFDMPENKKKSIEGLFDNLVRKTQWPMRVIIPLSARGALSLSRIQKNGNIIIDYYFNCIQDVGELTKYEAWDRNLIGPPAQNVLNVAVYLSLYWGYKETYLIGADSSFLEDLRVDQETNELFTIDTHFYDNKSVICEKSLFNAKQGRIMPEWTLYGLIYAYGKMFEGYYELKKYADYKGLKVYNASEYSWINVFERKKLR